MFFQAVFTVFIFIALKLQPRAFPDEYTLYLGDGSTKDHWPSKDQWMPFDDLFNRNQPFMTKSCAQFKVANDIQSETNDIRSAIQAISSKTGVDNRFVLAIVMQESGGCVRVPTTNFGVRNPGLMQSHDGKGTCNDRGSVLNPCPQNEITQMINDGTSFLGCYRYKIAHGFHPLAAGTSSGDGLIQILDRRGGPSAAAQSFYQTARIYNSGSIAASGKLEDGIATHCYASDVANRLLGWTFAPQGCNLG
ncbi:hypothetical protein V8E54_009530 [Elaphomyces granulatus]